MGAWNKRVVVSIPVVDRQPAGAAAGNLHEGVMADDILIRLHAVDAAAVYWDAAVAESDGMAADLDAMVAYSDATVAYSDAAAGYSDAAAG
jgi:hypothetical protein